MTKKTTLKFRLGLLRKTSSLLILLITASSLVSFLPTISQRGSISTRQNTVLDTNDLATKGLYFKKLFKNIYTGNFLAIPFDRDDQKFAFLYGAYLDAYGANCGASLPSDKVEITREECATEEVTTDGYGYEVSRTCVRWVTVGTGLYADPELYAAKMELGNLQRKDGMRNVFRILTQKNPMAEAQNLVNSTQETLKDVQALLEMNGCNTPALRRFEENLRLFALNKQPIKLGGETSTAESINFDPSKQDHSRLMEDLIYAHSKTWAMNQYISGSVSNVNISSTDAKGWPAAVNANYSYNGFSGRSNGSVKLTFSDGLPDCMYFFDFPTTCRTPSRRLVAEFAEGAYSKK